jgi:hypothetical protein
MIIHSFKRFLAKLPMTTFLVLNPPRRIVPDFQRIPHSVRKDPFIREGCENAKHFRPVSPTNGHSDWKEESFLVVISICAI